jgi:hypothetical protein
MSKHNKAEAPSKTGKASKSQLEALASKASNKLSVTEAAVTKKVTEKKDLLYIYPTEADTLEKRKKFRSQTRAKLKRLTRALKQAKKQADAAAIASAELELKKFRKEVLVNPDRE